MKKFPQKCRQKGTKGKADRLMVNIPLDAPAGQQRRYRRLYLGDWDSPASHAEYSRLKLQFEAGQPDTPEQYSIPHKSPLSIAELAERFLIYAEKRYQREGKPTTTLSGAIVAARILVESFGPMAVDDFTFSALNAIQAKLDASGQFCRNTINARISAIKQIFKWGRKNGLVERETIADLDLVQSLRRGESISKDYPKVESVQDAHVEAILPFLSPCLRAIILLLRYTGWRLSEVTSLKLGEIDRTKTPWIYTPAHHKTERKTGTKHLRIGPKARAIIEEYALQVRRNDDEMLFNPEDSLNQIGKRKGWLPRPEEGYKRGSVRSAILEACKKAGIPAWHPHQLRHSKATEIERAEGLRGVQAALAHADQKTSARYVDADSNLLDRLAEQYG